MSYSEPERNVHASWCYTSSDILLVQTSCYVVHFCKLVLVQTLIPDELAGKNSNTESKAINEEFFLSSWSLLECSRLFTQTIAPYTWHSMVPQKCNGFCLPLYVQTTTWIYSFSLSWSNNKIPNKESIQLWISDSTHTYYPTAPNLPGTTFSWISWFDSDHQNFITKISAACTCAHRACTCTGIGEHVNWIGAVKSLCLLLGMTAAWDAAE